ncbi:TTAGGG repeat binding factor [Elasticomyces elasticus]|uniref:TTAGGG repeat binding factor n=1 Tax=Exophiala sideris TaxID=1016849 RepID=A0ABR0IZY0_9EURO|nr:TTAGGG repeat binding factor [Elasticomyces elasticus]KAK5023247.1 TTAGGG repeat binding factor [Exophiala sideris]KAK5028619.1 TTAGGG repeat binding factor [Exophiala sideris]KAK5052997.1 TTAGGG repeat binding factor [Exophiala sideris]KAK5178737.1 TTAGGG repeat binding factor [Eurotiomycetes sp. CCFEE 6388]
MSSNPPSSRAPGDTGALPVAQKLEGQSSPPSTTPATPATVSPDDNPRSPKRRRLSPVDENKQNGDARTSNIPRSHDEQQKREGQRPVVGQTPTQTSSIPASSQKTVPSRPPQSYGPDRSKMLASLSLLDSLATQIIMFLARLTPTEALGLSNTPNSPKSREYAGLRALFDPTRRLFNTGAPFLSPRDLGLRENYQIETVRKANQAIFMSSIFTGEIGLRDMDRGFLPVFVPENGKLLKAQASIYLDLKTQGFITAWRTGAAPPQVVMADMFGPDLGKHILSRRPGATTLAPSEQDFLNRLSSRREILQTHVKNNTLDQLPIKYRWEDFSREVSSYLQKTMENTDSSSEVDGNQEDPTKNLQRGRMEGQFSIHAPPLPVTSTESTASPAAQVQSAPELLPTDDFVAQAARAAEIALAASGALAFQEQYPAVSSPATPTVKAVTPNPQPALPENKQYESEDGRSASKPPAPGAGNSTEIPHTSQTAPTSVLYERARLVASTKPALPQKQAAAPTQRRPWSTEEEQALMNGLDQVKGPHWSQILAMYGPGGTVSEALKDRNQVQLKDKARNLKLFFLKSGIEVPYYLQYVTGDLRTRAPGQASKVDDLKGDEMSFDDLDALMSFEADEAGLQSNQETTDSLQVNTSTESKPAFQPSMDDVEAMIARAAAAASQSIGSGWP